MDRQISPSEKKKTRNKRLMKIGGVGAAVIAVAVAAGSMMWTAVPQPTST